MRRIALLTLCLAGCAGGAAGGDDASVDGAVFGDAFGCNVGVVFSPVQPTAGETVYATASVPSASSFLTYTWTVQHDGLDVPFDAVATDGSRIRFDSTTAGPYYVGASVSGTDCYPYPPTPLNVRDPDATDTLWRLRVIAPPGAGAPPQELTVDVPSGANYDAGELALVTGATLGGAVRDSGGAGVPAYLRLVADGAPDLIVDGYAGSDGHFDLTTTLDRHDLLVVPFRADLPSYAIASWQPASGDLVIADGVAVTGTVLDPAGAALTGATVTAAVDGVPSTIGTTDATGHFALSARTGSPGLVVVTVVPPSASGLPRLTSAPAVLDLAQPLAVHYAPTLATRDVAGAAISQAGAGVPGAAITFTGTIAQAGTVATGATSAPATGGFAIRGFADGTSHLGTLLVPAAPTSAVVMPIAGAGGVVAVDLTSAAPATVDAPAAVAAAGRAVDSLGAPIANADVRATPGGALAAASTAEVHVTAGADGTFDLPLAGAGSYELTLVDPAGASALLRTTVVAGPIGDLALAHGLRFRGAVRWNGSDLPGAAVAIYCQACTGDARRRPAALAATDASGHFVVTLVDPGLP